MNEGNPRRNLEARNREFLHVNFNQLAGNFRGAKIALPDGSGFITIIDAKGFSREQNASATYKGLHEKQPGEVHIVIVQGVPITTVGALDGTQLGGCALLNRATKTVGDEVTRLKGASDITKELGLSRGAKAKLAYTDESDMLRVVVEEDKPEQQVSAQRKDAVSETAREALDDIVGK